MSDPRVPEPGPAGGDPDTAGPTAQSVSPAVPPKCATRTRLYRSGKLLAEGFPADQISEHLDADPDAVVWLDLHDPDEADLQIVTHEFGLHPLAVEDAVHDHQRPKLDRYRTHLFANMYAVAFDAGRAELTTSEISAFITPRALITVRKADFDVDTLVARWDSAPELASDGVGFLVHGLLDTVVDGHYNATEQLDEAIDDLEDRLFEAHPGVDIRRRGFELRRSLVQLRRVVVPTRELVSRVHNDKRLVEEDLAPYFQDVYDHSLHAAETLDAARDLIGGILETNVTEQGNDLNEITKKLASWAAIIAVPTAVTGFYGQNVPYPGFGHHSGFVISSVMIVVLAGGLYLILRRRGWL